MTAVAAVPEQQHMQALREANRVRLARARLKRRIASGEINVREVVLSVPWEVRSMTVSELLMSQRRWGSTRCRRFLASLSISETKVVGTMTERQRLALVNRLAIAMAA